MKKMKNEKENEKNVVVFSNNGYISNGLNPSIYVYEAQSDARVKLKRTISHYE